LLPEFLWELYTRVTIALKLTQARLPKPLKRSSTIRVLRKVRPDFGCSLRESGLKRIDAGDGRVVKLTYMLCCTDAVEDAQLSRLTIFKHNRIGDLRVSEAAIKPGFNIKCPSDFV
jgi:hypothetical protein